MNQKISKFLLILLFFFGLFARIYQFGQVPYSLYWDEVAIGLDAKSLLQTGKDINNNSWLQPLFISYGDYKAPVYIWLVTLIGKFLSVNQLSIRLPSLISFFATGFFLFKLVKLTSPPKSKVPLLTLLSLSIMPWSIHFSRIGMESHLSLFFLTLSIYLLVSAARNEQPVRIIFSALAVSLGIFTYISLRIIAPVLFIITFFIYHRSSLKKHLSWFISGLVIIATSTLILTNSSYYQTSQAYRLSNDNLITSTQHIDQSITAQGEKPTFVSRLVHHRYLYQSLAYAQNYLSHFSLDFLGLTGDPNLRHHSGFSGQILVIQVIFLALGIYVLLKSPWQSYTWLILSWLFLSPTVSALVNEVPHASRAIYLIIPLSWLIGLGLNQLNTQKHSLWLNLSLIALTINLSFYLHDYFYHYPSRSASVWLTPYKQAALALKDKPADQHVYITSQFYKPELYIAFYQNKNLNDLTDYSFFLPDTCPVNSWCVAPPDWQEDTTAIIKYLSGTDELVIKQGL